MGVTRRRVLSWLAASPLLASGGCRCTRAYPAPRIAPAIQDAVPVRPLLAPRRPAGIASAAPAGIVDVHAHFFNASDVPVRGFVAECLGHRAPPAIQRLLKFLAAIADRVAERAPTAMEEMDTLTRMLSDAPVAASDASRFVDDAISAERREAARRVVEAIRGTDFEREYRRLKRGAAIAVAAATDGPVTADEVLAVVTRAEQRGAAGGAAAAAAGQDAAAAEADGMLAFLTYMLSMRWNNVQSYMRAFAPDEHGVGISRVYGALVDFDRWLDCPPRSAHHDQVALHALLARLHGDFLKPLVAYNPWADIAERGAGLARVRRACSSLGFAGVKIYPPTGFLPAGNTGRPHSPKGHPGLQRLDETMAAFFDACARENIAVLAHAARSNGRDDVHDEFGGAAGWRRVLAGTAADNLRVCFGHFGGGSGQDWTREFATLMHAVRSPHVFADLGYWEELMCPSPTTQCNAAIARLSSAMRLPASGGQRVVDRVMFATDWLMLSQVRRWADYPAQVVASLRTFLDEQDVVKVTTGNAHRFFGHASS